MKSLQITPDVAPHLHDGICRAIDQGLRITQPPESFRFGSRTYWTVDSASTPGDSYIVMVERQLDGSIVFWCECEAGLHGHVCKHAALALDDAGLIPRGSE